MRAITVGTAFTALLIGVVIFEEGRISRLERELAALRNEPARSASGPRRRPVDVSPALSGNPGGPTSKSAVARGGTNKAPGEPFQGDADLADTFRQMIENPVGRAMIAEEHKLRANRIYGDLIVSFGLKGEEKDYFLELVAAGVGEEDTIGMKLLTAGSPEDRSRILDEMEDDQEKRRQAVREFLNNDEDFAKYELYEDRKEIYEQMPGLRAAMQERGSPMTGDQEEQLVEAIHQASVQSSFRAEWDGRGAFEQFERAGATKRFEENWDEMQRILHEDAGIILENTEQQEAFREHQAQVGNMALMGIKFVEGMIAAQRGGAE